MNNILLKLPMLRFPGLLVVVIYLATMSSSFSASFDCTKPRTQIDSLICNSVTVLELDETLSSLYIAAQLYQQEAMRQAVVDVQNKWLSDQRNKCVSESCLISTYQLRIMAIKDLLPSEPLICPQCGTWEISSSNVSWLVSDLVLIDEKGVRIKGCGHFFYDNSNIEASRVSEKRHDYLFTTQFSGRAGINAASICGGDDETLWDPRKWQLEMKITGHFQEAGYADFVLTQSDLKDPVLTFRAWSEDPCGAGSGFGSAECFLTNNGELRKALWMAIDSAEFSVAGRWARKAQRPFNLNAFLDRVQRYCSIREKDSGGGAWPGAWTQGCVGEQLSIKLKQFRGFENCSRTKSTANVCKFPKDVISN